jgi:hypothetical protein
MYLKKLVLLAAGLLLAVYGLEAQTEARKYSNEFLKIGIGARAFGMGNAQAGVVDDVTAGYWNPAALAQEGMHIYPEVALMHSAYFANIATYNYAGFTMPVDSTGRRRFGVTLIRIGVDDIQNTLDLIDQNGNIDYDRITSFSASDFAALFSYAWRPSFLKGLSFGTNIKVIYRGVGRFANAWGFGIDLAAKYQRPHFQAGLVLNDATNTFNAWTFNTETFEDAFINTGNEVPQNSIELTRPSLRLGLGYDFNLGSRLNMLLALDSDFYFDGQRSSIISGGTLSIDPHMGFEFSFLNEREKKIAFLRGGFYNLQNVVDDNGEDAVGIFPTAGVGFVIKNFQIDYALANIGNFSENLHSHVVSLKFHIRK